MSHYFEWATELPMSEVQATLRAIASRELHPRDAKRKLARTITAELHSAAAAEEAERDFDRIHKEKAAPSEVEDVREVRVDGAKEIPIVDLLVMAKLRPSRSTARQLVEGRGVKVDGSTASLDTSVPVKGEPVVQYGKRNYARIRFR